MEALQAAIALSETVSVDSDTSRILEAGVDRPGQRRGRKQSKPLRSAFSSDTPSDCQPQAAAKQQQTSIILVDPTTGDSPAFNNQAGGYLEDAAAAACARVHVSSSKGSSKGSPAQRQGPCGHCKTPYSPQWRKGPRNKPVLCNACGIRYLRNRHLGRAVPQKKRFTGPTAKAAASPADSSAGEGSIDTLTDTTDMRGPSKKRKTKKVELGEELTSLSTYSYDESGLQAMGSVGSLQQMLLQHQHSSYNDAHPTHTDAAAGRGSDVSHAVADTRTGAGADRPAGTAADAKGVSFGTSMAMPGNMQPLLAPVHSATSGHSSIYGGGYGMALALQLYQQQQQQLLLNQQHLLLSQASSGAAGLQSAGYGLNSSSSSAGPVLQAQGSSGPGTPAHPSTAQLSPAQATLLYTQSLQMQQLQGYMLQQQQQAHALHAVSMLHGPSPLSVMSSAGPSVSGFVARAAGSSLLSMPPVPAASTALPAAPSLEITPLVCSGGKAPSAAPQAPTTAAGAPTGPSPMTAAALPALGTAAAAGGVLGSFQSLLAA